MREQSSGQDHAGPGALEQHPGRNDHARIDQVQRERVGVWNVNQVHRQRSAFAGIDGKRFDAGQREREEGDIDDLNSNEQCPQGNGWAGGLQRVGGRVVAG